MLSDIILKTNIMVADGIDDIINGDSSSQTETTPTGNFDVFKNSSVSDTSIFSGPNSTITDLLTLIYKLEYKVAGFSIVIAIICTGIAWALSKDSRDVDKNKKGLITICIAGAVFFALVSIVDVIWLQIAR